MVAGFVTPRRITMLEVAAQAVGGAGAWAGAVAVDVWVVGIRDDPLIFQALPAESQPRMTLRTVSICVTRSVP